MAWYYWAGLFALVGYGCLVAFCRWIDRDTDWEVRRVHGGGRKEYERKHGL